MKAIILILIIFLLPLTPLNAKEPLQKITLSGGVPLDVNSPTTGVVIPVYKEAFKRLGIEFTALYYPEKRSPMESNLGNVDGELSRVKNFHEVSDHKFPNLIRVESPVYLGEWAAFGVKDSPTVNSLSDLKGKRVVYNGGVNWLKKKVGPEQAEVQTVSTVEAALKFTALGRADYTLMSKSRGQIIIKRLDLNLVYRGSIGEANSYPYLHKKHQELGIKLADVLNEMQSDGSYQKIYNQYWESESSNR